MKARPGPWRKRTVIVCDGHCEYYNQVHCTNVIIHRRYEILTNSANVSLSIATISNDLEIYKHYIYRSEEEIMSFRNDRYQIELIMLDDIR